MAGTGARPTARAQEMRRVVERWARSGLTQREFAAREGIAPGTLGWWRHVLGARVGVGRPRVASAADGPAAREHSQFVEVRGVPALGEAPGVRIEIRLPHGPVLFVPPEIGRAALREIVAGLAAAC